MATLIGLCIRVKLLRALPSRFKVCAPPISQEYLKSNRIRQYCIINIHEYISAAAYFEAESCGLFLSAAVQNTLWD